MSVGWAQLLAGLLIGLGLLSIGLYTGLGIREGREDDRRAKIALARIAARQAARPPVVYVPSRPAPPRAPKIYLPGYADAFPRAGRFALEHADMIDPEAPPRPRMPTGRPNYHPADFKTPEQAHGPALRPITSPVDLDGAVRLMCIETELYVAGLIAGTRHTERNEDQ